MIEKKNCKLIKVPPKFGTNKVKENFHQKNISTAGVLRVPDIPQYSRQPHKCHIFHPPLFSGYQTNNSSSELSGHFSSQRKNQTAFCFPTEILLVTSLLSFVRVIPPSQMSQTFQV